MSFTSLLIHTCTIQKRTEAAGSAANYGHGSVTWADFATSVACRLNPRAAGQGELVTQQAEGAPISFHTLFVAWRSDLAADGASHTYRITNIKDAGGTVIDAGPFDIGMVRDAAGMKRHMEIPLVRPPVSA